MASIRDNGNDGLNYDVDDGEYRRTNSSTAALTTTGMNATIEVGTSLYSNCYGCSACCLYRN